MCFVLQNHRMLLNPEPFPCPDCSIGSYRPIYQHYGRRIVGIVVGAGIFRAPSLVAANTGSDSMFFLAWILGGMLLKNWLKFFCYICTMRMTLML